MKRIAETIPSLSPIKAIYFKKERAKTMKNTLPNLVVNGRTYTPATNATKMGKYLLKNFDSEAFSLSELVPDLSGYAINTCFKFDNENMTYVLSFAGHKDEFSVVTGPILTKEMIKEGFILLSVNALNDRLKFEGVEFWKTGIDWFNDMESTIVYSN